ncbi:MAG: hypothetical protein ACK4TG_01560 [Thermaurantiacus sp.]
MIKQNRWTHGETNFGMPPPAPEQRGKLGCRFGLATFDAAIGEEVFLSFQDEPAALKRLATVTPLTVIAHSGMVRTPDGIVGFIVWQIAAGSRQEAFVEQWLNPNRIGTIRLLASAANQTNLKFVAMDGFSGEVAVMVDFANSFGIGELVQKLALAIGHEPDGDFSRAVAYAEALHSTEQLVLLATLELDG